MYVCCDIYFGSKQITSNSLGNDKSDRAPIIETSLVITHVSNHKPILMYYYTESSFLRVNYYTFMVT